jgi:hypothetical protein
MDENTRRLVSLIIDDTIDRHTRAVQSDLCDYDLKLVRMRQEDRARKEAQNLPQPAYEGYGSGRWVHEATILKAHAESLIADLAQAIRVQTTAAWAGVLFVEGAKAFLSLLDETYQGRFNHSRPFYGNGRSLSLPPYWANERLALERKVQIEDLQFAQPTTKPAAPGLISESSVVQATSEGWSHDRMMAEIASCPIANREKAWIDYFKPRFDEHGWGNEAFRAIWSDARKTKGMTGRPAKSA